uniref:Poly(A) polymerase catalytic subunit domain-containing protein n=1 Tax=viral metagenome TaxID=1070528 RepID=A0A6C0CER6_9ZZZZ
MEVEEVIALAQEQIDKEAASDPDVKKMIKIVREFIETHRVMCYGGTAINNLLPPEDQFYDFSIEIPDYDFFSETPQLHAAKLGDRLANAGFASVEVKPGVHLGTWKVFANYIGVADVSHMEVSMFKKLWDEKITKDKISYVPPNFLRMAMYLELSRPKGDVSRWKKVYKRLQLLNKHHPMTCPAGAEKITDEFVDDTVRDEIRDILVKDHLVLLGFNGSMVQEKTPRKWMLPLDVLVTPEKRAEVSKKIMAVFKKHESVKSREFPEFEELMPARTDIRNAKNVLVRLYETTACHSYHETPSGLRVASIPTLLQFFLSALYAPKEFLEAQPEQRFLCTAEHLVNLANSTSRRYKILTPLTCIGTQKNLVSMRAERSEIYNKLKENRESREFLELFFSYVPTDLNKTQRQKVRKSLKKTLRRR